MTSLRSDQDSTRKNLLNQEAMDKVRDICLSAHVCFFLTTIGTFPLHADPMAIQSVDDDGYIWFLSSRSSERNLEILQDPRVQLLVANTGASKYLNLHGTAFIRDERALKEKHWNDLAKPWFAGGVDDPDLTVLEVSIDKGHYWDTKHGPLVTWLSLTAAAVTGTPWQGGLEGTVQVKAPEDLLPVSF